MRIAIFLLVLGSIVMAGAIAYAMLAGDFFGEARVLFGYPWFQLSMVDLYVGFLLFGGWIVCRERSLLVAVVWIVLVLTLGNFASCLYALMAAIRARGDWRTFWLGCRANAGGSADAGAVRA